LRYPFKPGYSPLSHAPSYENIIFQQIESADYSDFWKQLPINAEEHIEEFADVPTIFVGSWYDIYAKSTVQFFEALSNIKTSSIKLIMGPWSHDSEHSVAGEVDFGPDACVEGDGDAGLLALQLRWFDRWLKDVQNGAEHDPAVRYFKMGGGNGLKTGEGNLSHGGAWCSSSTWPPADVKPVSLYLGGGRLLSTTPPSNSPGFSGFQYDPRNPVPSIGGNLFRHENILWPGAYDQRERADFFLCREPYLPLSSRHDVLVFVTPPLEEALEVSGTIRAKLYVSSSAPDTDFTMKIVDEYPPNENYPLGFAVNITHGIIRCRYRSSPARAELMEPGQVYEVNINLYPTCNLFEKGHRLRVDISSSNYPHFDINTNTGEPFGNSQRMIIADNQVYHNLIYPSQITLPVISTSRPVLR
jgi:putative CocE/NonD family hydrolase